MDKFNPQLTLVARILLGLIFVLSAISKLQGYEGFQSYMEAGGVPGVLAPLVVAIELFGGICVIIGYRARVAALTLAGFTLAAGILYHMDFGDQTQMAMFMKNLAIAGGLLLIFIHGAGAYALAKD